MKHTDETFVPGDVVIWWTGSTWSQHEVWGKVTRVTPKGTVFVHNGDKEVSFRSGRGLRKPSEHELAHRMWLVRRPKGEVAHVNLGFGYSNEVQGARVDVLDTPEKIRQAAAELLAIAAWWEEEPKA